MHRDAKVSIPNYTQEFEGGKEVTFYKISLKIEGCKWELKKRFSDFHDLNECLKKVNGNLPALPGKTLFRIKSHEEIDKRREGLERYLQNLAERVDIYSSQIFVKFLELDSHKPELAINLLEKVGQIRHLLMGYRDMQFSSNRKFYYSVTSDPKALSRVDSYLTNMNMPWDKKHEKDMVLLAVGNLEAWYKKKKGGNDFHYERLFLKTFKSQAICLAFSEELNLIAVGCDNGQMGVFLLDKKDPQKFTELFLDKVHTDRIMRIFIDHKTKMIYSIGEDKFLKVYNIEGQGVSDEVHIGKSKLCEMVVDSRNRIAYISDRNGNITVVSLKIECPEVCQVIKTSSEGAIRGLEGDFSNKKLYCTCHDDGYVHGFKLREPEDPEGRIDKFVSVKGPPKPRQIKFWEERGELFVGHQDGLISVYNLELNPKGAICSSRYHEDNINSIQILEGSNMIATGSTDKTIMVILF